MQTSGISSTATDPASGGSANPEPDGKRAYVLGVVSTSHFLNHVQMSVNAVLLPVMMKEIGFDIFQLGVIASLNQLSGSAMQAIWGLLVQYHRRSVLLGMANVVLGVFGVVQGFTQTYVQVLGVRLLAGLGSSAQNPLGASMLATTFRRAKGRVLGIHQTAGNIGSVIAPLVIVAMLRFLDWRQIWIVLAVPTMLMGCAYLFIRDVGVGMGVSRKRGFRAALSSYATCLRSREVLTIAAIQMAGAAGRGTGIDFTYFVPFFQTWLGVGTEVAGVLLAVQQLGSVVGPFSFGYLSDRTSRRWALLVVLTLSSVSTISLLLHSQVGPALVLNLLLYGAVVNSRESLTLSMVSEAVPERHCDAAFSIYYFIGFMSGPAWTVLMGFLVRSNGFGVAFTVVSLSYLVGMALLALLGRSKKATVRAAP